MPVLEHCVGLRWMVAWSIVGGSYLTISVRQPRRVLGYDSDGVLDCLACSNQQTQVNLWI